MNDEAARAIDALFETFPDSDMNQLIKAVDTARELVGDGAYEVLVEQAATILLDMSKSILV